MPEIDLADDVFVTVAPREVARWCSDPVRWRRQWPDLVLRVDLDRGEQGIQWNVSGALTGTMEIWLKPVLDGTVVHYFLRAELPDAAAERTGASAGYLRTWRVNVERTRRRWVARRLLFELKRRCEAGRAPGCPPDPEPSHDRKTRQDRELPEGTG